MKGKDFNLFSPAIQISKKIITVKKIISVWEKQNTS